MRQARSHESRLVRAALLVLTASPAAYGGIAADWNKPAGGTWTEATNWTSNLVPGASDTATFELGTVGGYTVMLPGPTTAVNILAVRNEQVTLVQDAGSTTTIGIIGLGGSGQEAASLTLSGGAFSVMGGVAPSYSAESTDLRWG